MLHNLGHHVIHYGVEGSDPECSENVVTVPGELYDKVHRRLDWRNGFNLNPRELTNVLHIQNCNREIALRKEPGDFLCCTFGYAHKPMADANPDMIVVETGIGYGATFAPYRVWETYAWMHYCYGKDQLVQSPPWHDAVIPPYVDLDDFPFNPVKSNYAIHVGRPTILKGRAVAVEMCEKAGVPLYVAGQGHEDSPDYTNLGVLSIEERARWVGGAKALLAPTLYIEPGGNVSIEANAYGTPAITTDWGCFTETVIHGETGWRCRSMGEFVWALQNADQINPARCREVVEDRYSLEKVGAMYEHYFAGLLEYHRHGEDAWHASDPGRTQLDWLRREP